MLKSIQEQDNYQEERVRLSTDEKILKTIGKFENELHSQLYRRNVEYKYFRNNFIVAKAGHDIYEIPPCFVRITNVTIKTTSEQTDTEEEEEEEVCSISDLMEKSLWNTDNEKDNHDHDYTSPVEVIDITKEVQEKVPENDNKTKRHNKQRNNTKCLRIAERIRARREQEARNHDDDKNKSNKNNCAASVDTPFCEFPTCITGTAGSIVDTIEKQLEKENYGPPQPTTIRIIEEQSNSAAVVHKERMTNNDGIQLQGVIPASKILPFSRPQTLPNGIQWKIADNYVYQHSLRILSANQVHSTQQQQQQHLWYSPNTRSNDMIMTDPNKFETGMVREPDYQSKHQQLDEPSTLLRMYNHPIVPRSLRFATRNHSNSKGSTGTGSTLRHRLGLKNSNEIFIPRVKHHPPLHTMGTNNSHHRAETDWRYASYVALAQQRSQVNTCRNFQNQRNGQVISSRESSKQSNVSSNQILQPIDNPDHQNGHLMMASGIDVTANNKKSVTPELVRSLRQPVMSKPFGTGHTQSVPSTLQCQPQTSHQNNLSCLDSTPVTTASFTGYPNNNNEPGIMMSTNNSGSTQCCQWTSVCQRASLPGSIHQITARQEYHDQQYYKNIKSTMSTNQPQQRTRYQMPSNFDNSYNKSIPKDDMLTLTNKRRVDQLEDYSNMQALIPTRESQLKPMSKLERAIRNLSEKCNRGPTQQQKVYDNFIESGHRPNTNGMSTIGTPCNQYPYTVRHLNSDQRIEPQNSNSSLEKLLQYPTSSFHRSKMLPHPNNNNNSICSSLNNSGGININKHNNHNTGRQQTVAMNLATARRMENSPQSTSSTHLLNSILRRNPLSNNLQHQHHPHQNQEQLMNDPYNKRYPSTLSNSNAPTSTSTTASLIRNSWANPRPPIHQYHNSRLQALLLSKTCSSPVLNSFNDSSRQNNVHDHSSSLRKSGEFNNSRPLNPIGSARKQNFVHKDHNVSMTSNGTTGTLETTVNRLIKEAETYKAVLISKNSNSYSSPESVNNPMTSLSQQNSKLPDCPDLWSFSHLDPNLGQPKGPPSPRKSFHQHTTRRMTELTKKSLSPIAGSICPSSSSSTRLVNGSSPMHHQSFQHFSSHGVSQIRAIIGSNRSNLKKNSHDERKNDCQTCSNDEQSVTNYFSRLSDESEDEIRVAQTSNEPSNDEAIEAKVQQNTYIQNTYSDICNISNSSSEDGDEQFRTSQEQVTVNNRCEASSDLNFFCTEEDRSFIT